MILYTYLRFRLIFLFWNFKFCSNLLTCLSFKINSGGNFFAQSSIRKPLLSPIFKKYVKQERQRFITFPNTGKRAFQNSLRKALLSVMSKKSLKQEKLCFITYPKTEKRGNTTCSVVFCCCCFFKSSEIWGSALAYDISSRSNLNLKGKGLSNP